jgi:hypothetical protein
MIVNARPAVSGQRSRRPRTRLHVDAVARRWQARIRPWPRTAQPTPQE